MISTPAEAFLAVEAASQKAVSPPRARKAEGPQETAFTIGFLDPDTRAFPILNKAASSEALDRVAQHPRLGQRSRLPETPVGAMPPALPAPKPNLAPE